MAESTRTPGGYDPTETPETAASFALGSRLINERESRRLSIPDWPAHGPVLSLPRRRCESQLTLASGQLRAQGARSRQQQAHPDQYRFPPLLAPAELYLAQTNYR